MSWTGAKSNKAPCKNDAHARSAGNNSSTFVAANSARATSIFLNCIAASPARKCHAAPRKPPPPDNTFSASAGCPSSSNTVANARFSAERSAPGNSSTRR
jgi:hypothetical protein